ncbi:phosphomethylpyrimidine kinase [Klebsormidium nitens]|uniref:thiamine phosphate synthase n=1 Tax=Klebsormidium nitens TaxID=105231 RepID=A0A0U9HHS2_KLENI|nr:phosphomethylpyrimidine kinase [Klebsormidium nitens]|eukprot:GAQ77629.1 phosphomethylpyrimidine kinase [Klebsormidium nitens]
MKTAGALGVYSMSVVTALTAQNTAGVQGIHPVPADFVRAQVEAVLSDIGCDCVKTGMLPSADIIRAVVECLAKRPAVRLVVDPVMVATSGDVLVGGDTLGALRELLLPRADVITPNLPEAKALLGWEEDITDLEGMKRAATALFELGPKAVLVKGGHVAGGRLAVDVLFDGERLHELEAGWVDTRNTHGTGCTLASGIAAELAKGRPLVAAVSAAKGYLTEALKSSAWLQLGQGKHGPLNHFYGTTSWGTSRESPRARFRPSDLAVYAVSDSRMNARWGRSNVEAMRAAIEGGATILQLREKDIGTGDFVKEAQEVVALAREAGVPLVINDRIDVALAVGADGVHIGQSDMPLRLARALLGPDRIIGISTKTPEQARKALEDGADYLGSGGVFPTNTKENNVTIGIKGLLEVCESTPLPVVAIGGIKTTNAAEVLSAAKANTKGPDGVAIVSGVFDQPDVAKATKDLETIVNSALSKRQDLLTVT